MKKIKFKPTILKGNEKILIEKAGTYGLNLQDFLYMLAEVDWYCLNRDVIVHKKVLGEKIPKELEVSIKPKKIQIENENTERLDVYVEPETEYKLKLKTKMYGLRSIGVLIDKICSEPLEFLNPDLLNSIKHNGGKK